VFVKVEGSPDGSVRTRVPARRNPQIPHEQAEFRRPSCNGSCVRGPDRLGR
jgi:hypothetical protein